MAANSWAPGQESRELGVPLTISPAALPGWGKQRDCHAVLPRSGTGGTQGRIADSVRRVGRCAELVGFALKRVP